MKKWFNRSPTYSPLSTTALRLRDITNPNPFIVEALNENHFPSATSKPKPALPKFPNRIKAAVSHNEYCILGQVFLALTTAPPEVYHWFEDLGKDAKGVRNTARSLRAMAGVGKEACERAIQMTRDGGEVSVTPLKISPNFLCMPNTNSTLFFSTGPCFDTNWSSPKGERRDIDGEDPWDC